MKIRYLALASATLFAATAAQAQTAYTNKATFLAAAGSTQTETFGNAAVGNFSTTPTFNAVFDGFRVSGNNGGNYVGIASGTIANQGDDTAISTTFNGQRFLGWGNIAGGIMSMTITFNTATTAFGFDWFNTDVTDSYSINIPGGTVFNSPPFNLSNGSLASSGFFGLVSNTAFTTIVITNNQTGGYMSTEGMDNFITNGAGSVNGVPEPATWGMMIAGFGMMGAAMRTRRRSTKVSFA